MTTETNHARPPDAAAPPALLLGCGEPLTGASLRGSRRTTPASRAAAARRRLLLSVELPARLFEQRLIRPRP